MGGMFELVSLYVETVYLSLSGDSLSSIIESRMSFLKSTKFSSVRSLLIEERVAISWLDIGLELCSDFK